MVAKPDPVIVIGISAYYHDAAAAILVDGAIVAAAHEERFTRKKHDPSFPARALRYCLAEAGCTLADATAIVFYDKPILKFERILEICLASVPRGLGLFISSMTVWVKEKLFLEDLLRKELKKIAAFGRDKKVLFSEHHLSHAASAFYPSPFEDAAILTIDGVGEWATASISRGTGKNIVLMKELYFPHSVGLLYSAFTQYLGFKVNSGEYKLMGLAPYGTHGSAEVAHMQKLITDRLVTIAEDGSIFLHEEYFDYVAGLSMVNAIRWEALFGFPPRTERDEIETKHADLALAIQEVTEEIMLRMARHAKALTGARYLCLAGGVALNCVGNARILEAKIFDDVWIQPAAGDAGGALGAALAAYHLALGRPRPTKLRKSAGGDDMQGSYLGPAFDDTDIASMLKSEKAVAQKFASEDALCDAVADLLAHQKVVGWFQGRMEWGPRALGNRSILADPRSPEMQKKLNLMIKFREGFRPFAPSVLLEDVRDYFDFGHSSPYMLFIAPVTKSRRLPLPEGYEALDWRDKLYHLRSDIPSVTHLDYSARLQTVSKADNPLYHRLISAFKKKTGYGLVVNTSFNVRGEPIVCTPREAFTCFMHTHMDAVALGPYLLLKEHQKEVAALEMGDTYGTD
jgi:carbamoyltransferase